MLGGGFGQDTIDEEMFGEMTYIAIRAMPCRERKIVMWRRRKG
jgi:hypothetical protein